MPCSSSTSRGRIRLRLREGAERSRAEIAPVLSRPCCRRTPSRSPAQTYPLVSPDPLAADDATLVATADNVCCRYRKRDVTLGYGSPGLASGSCHRGRCGRDEDSCRHRQARRLGSRDARIADAYRLRGRRGVSARSGRGRSAWRWSGRRWLRPSVEHGSANWPRALGDEPAPRRHRSS